jgi:antitoxin PrlF
MNFGYEEVSSSSCQTPREGGCGVDATGALHVIKSKLTSQGRTVIPASVRAALALRRGDEIAYAIEDARVIMTKAASPGRADDPFWTFSEWSSEADRQAYEDL